jgi:hypothetical protein
MASNAGIFKFHIITPPLGQLGLKGWGTVLLVAGALVENVSIKAYHGFCDVQIERARERARNEVISRLVQVGIPTIKAALPYTYEYPQATSSGLFLTQIKRRNGGPDRGRDWQRTIPHASKTWHPGFGTR